MPTLRVSGKTHRLGASRKFSRKERDGRSGLTNNRRRDARGRAKEEARGRRARDEENAPRKMRTREEENIPRFSRLPYRDARGRQPPLLRFIDVRSRRARRPPAPLSGTRRSLRATRDLRGTLHVSRVNCDSREPSLVETRLRAFRRRNVVRHRRRARARYAYRDRGFLASESDVNDT